MGAETSLDVATAPELDGVSGRYFVNTAAQALEPFASDDDSARRRGELSEGLTGFQHPPKTCARWPTGAGSATGIGLVASIAHQS